jgi:plasmid stabilization system protein ParE
MKRSSGFRPLSAVRVRFTRRATAQLDAIFDYIARDNPTAAAASSRAIEDRVPSLRFPQAGSLRGEAFG